MNLILIYLVAIIEGFSTLAVQMIALRNATPIVGSSIILTSVYIGVILLALSAGYYFGGIISSRYSKQKLHAILAGYLIFAALRYLFITFYIDTSLITFLLENTQSYILTLFLVALILFFIPVFIASQTLPLLTEIIPEESKGKAAGSILFASTVGSFLGSVLTSIILFQTLGVNMTASLVGSGLIGAAALVLLPYYRKASLATAIVMIAVFFISTQVQHQSAQDILYSFDSAYQEISIREMSYGGRPVYIYHTNGAFSSGIFKDSGKSPFQYIREVVGLTEKLQPKRVLVIGAAGFVYPQEIAQLPYVERIDTVDIDPQVKRIAEEEFLEQPLNPKINFYAQSARYFINQAIAEGVTYDLILVDAYNGKTVPDELTTVEFFAALDQIADKSDILYNVIMDNQLSSSFAENILATFQQVYGDVYAKNVSLSPSQPINNFIVGFQKFDTDYTLLSPKSGVVYTDDKRSTEIDIVNMFWTL